MKGYLLILHDADDPTPSGRRKLKERIVKRFRLPSRAVEEMFLQLPVIIKRDVAEQDAKNYLAAFEALGAIVEILEEPEKGSPQTAFPAADVSGTFAEVDPSAEDPEADSHEADLSALDDELSDLSLALERELEEDRGVEAAQSSAEPPLNTSGPEDSELAFQLAPEPVEESAGPPGSPESSQSEVSTEGDGLDLSLSLGEPEPISEDKRICPKPPPEKAPAQPKKAPLSGAGSSATKPLPAAQPEPAAAPAARTVTESSPPPDKAAQEPAASIPAERQAEDLSAAEINRAFAKSPAAPLETSSPSGKPSEGLGEEPDAEISPVDSSSSKRRKKLLYLTLALLAALGLFIHLRPQPESVRIDLNRLLAQQKQILAGQKKKDQEKRTNELVTARFTANKGIFDSPFELVLDVSDNQVLDYQLNFETPRPAKLTPEEIAAGKKPGPWLRRFASDSLEHPIDLIEGEATLGGTGKAYLQDLHGGKRVQTQVSISLSINPERSAASGVWFVSRNAAPEVISGNSRIERGPGTDFTILCSGEFHAARTELPAQPPLSPAAVEPAPQPSK